MLLNDLPPWSLVYQQTQRWFKAGCFEAMVPDLRAAALDRWADAGSIRGRARQLPPMDAHPWGTSGPRQRQTQKEVKVRMAVDTLGQKRPFPIQKQGVRKV